MKEKLPAVAPFPKERSLDHPFFVPLTFAQTPYAGPRVLYRQVSNSWHWVLHGLVVSHMDGFPRQGVSPVPVDSEIALQVIHVPAGSRTLFFLPVNGDNVGGPGPSDGSQNIGGAFYPFARERARYVPMSNIFAPGDTWGLRVEYLDLAPGDLTPLVRILAIGRHCSNTQGGSHVC
jgi:hypothetical protein